ncbi:MAG TPA: DNA-directed RNA polymerase subunit omega [Actinomycetota bacterium]|nr:DNA-directed RNA polymerase subunit omega [Actinomycetota bacterium]
MIEPKIEALLETVDNQYTLVVLSARRARQIVDFYAKLGMALPSEEKPMQPLLETSVHGVKPLTVSLREVEQQRVGWERPTEAEESFK